MSSPDLPLWTPSPQRVAASRLTAFARAFAPPEARTDAEALHRWSVDHPGAFWRAVAAHAGLIAEGLDGPALVDAAMPGARWFPDARLSFAENLLAPGDDADEAIVFATEQGPRRRMSRGELRALVARVARALTACGVGPGDRVAAWMPNLPETVALMLAANAVGATFTSASPDFGARGVLERFGQVQPKVLVAVDGTFYGGRRHDCVERLGEIVRGLPSLAAVVLVPHAGGQPADDVPGLQAWAAWLDAAPAGPEVPDFLRLPFDHPLYIMYSSGTTGPPKCIVHGAGGTLLKHAEELALQCDVRAGDRVFYYTTCGWMMWNWLVSALALGATLILWDGSPFAPRPEVLWDLAQDERVTLFGASAKYLDAMARQGLSPARTHRLDALRLLTSTGSPLSPEGFGFVYDHIKADLHLASISGGTDIIGCFVLGDPWRPVWRGEIQGAALGMDVAVFDGEGRPVRGEPGELVCRRPFPSMPLGFLGDAEGARYRAAYFEHFPGVWTHGDWAEQTPRGGFIIHGRSDATLNPGGVRIGTAEIYRVVEQLDEVVEAIAVGQRWEGDVRVVLFVRLQAGIVLDAPLIDRIRRAVREGCSPRHVPARVLAVPDIPRTRSGKITELAVRAVVHGERVRNEEALANPEALAWFKDRPELAV